VHKVRNKEFSLAARKQTANKLQTANKRMPQVHFSRRMCRVYPSVAQWAHCGGAVDAVLKGLGFSRTADHLTQQWKHHATCACSIAAAGSNCLFNITKHVGSTGNNLLASPLNTSCVC
jgi:hypothetical protein